MSKTETGDFRSEGSGAANAFCEVNLLHPEVQDTVSIENLSLEKKREVASDYLTVCVVYFANDKDDYLRRIGTTILDAINSGSVEVATNVRQVNTAETQLSIELSNEKASLLMPLEFIVLARKQPIMALVIALGAFSRIVDFLNGDAEGRLVEERVEATQAHFLKGVGDHPEITSHPYCAGILSKYPNGIFSLSKKRFIKDQPSNLPY